MFVLVWILGKKFFTALIIFCLMAVLWGVMFGVVLSSKDSETKIMYEQMTNISKAYSKCIRNAFLERFFMQTTLDYPVAKDGQNIGIVLSYFLTKSTPKLLIIIGKNTQNLMRKNFYLKSKKKWLKILVFVSLKRLKNQIQKLKQAKNKIPNS